MLSHYLKFSTRNPYQERSKLNKNSCRVIKEKIGLCGLLLIWHINIDTLPNGWEVSSATSLPRAATLPAFTLSGVDCVLLPEQQRSMYSVGFGVMP